MTTIDLRDPELASALDEWAEALAAYAQQAQMLVEDIQQSFGLTTDDGLFGFDHIVLGSEVKIAGEWHRVLGKVTRSPSGVQSLLVAEGSKAAWTYEVTPGERFAVAELF